MSLSGSIRRAHVMLAARLRNSRPWRAVARPFVAPSGDLGCLPAESTRAGPSARSLDVKSWCDQGLVRPTTTLVLPTGSTAPVAKPEPIQEAMCDPDTGDPGPSSSGRDPPGYVGMACRERPHDRSGVTRSQRRSCTTSITIPTTTRITTLSSSWKRDAVRRPCL